MDKSGHFYELTEEQRKAVMGDGYEDTTVAGVAYETLREDQARLDGYLKARAEVDRLAVERARKGAC